MINHRAKSRLLFILQHSSSVLASTFCILQQVKLSAWSTYVSTVVLLSTLHGLTENRNISKTVRNITNPMSFSSLTNKGKAEKAWNTTTSCKGWVYLRGVRRICMRRSVCGSSQACGVGFIMMRPWSDFNCILWYRWWYKMKEGYSWCRTDITNTSIRRSAVDHIYCSLEFRGGRNVALYHLQNLRTCAAFMSSLSCKGFENLEIDVQVCPL